MPTQNEETAAGTKPSALEGPVPGASRFLLVVGEDHYATYALPDHRTIVIGRDPDCDIPLPSPKISRRHTCLHTGESIEVEDLGSTNGTQVAGRKLKAGKRTV